MSILNGSVLILDTNFKQMKKLLFGILIIAAIPVFAQNTEEVRAAFNKFEFEKVIEMAECHEADLNLTLLKAKAYKNLQQYKQSAEIIEGLIQEKPDSLALLIELADTYHLSGNYLKAQQRYEQALALSPENTFIRIKHLYAHYHLKNWTKTIECGKNIFQKDTVSSILPIIADCYAQLENPDSAIVLYNKRMLDAPDDVRSLAKLLSIYFKKEKYEDVINQTEQYIRQIDSTNHVVNQYNGFAYCFDNQYDKAVYRLKKLYEEGDSTFINNYYLGSSYYGKQDYYSAYEHLNMAYQKDSMNINVHFYLGRSGILSSYQKEGIAVLHKGLELLIPKNEELYNYYNTLASGYWKIDKNNESIKYYKLAIEHNPRAKLPLYSIASIYDMRLKNPKEALKYYRLFVNAFEPKSADEERDTSNLTYYDVAKKRIEILKEQLFFETKP